MNEVPPHPFHEWSDKRVEQEYTQAYAMVVVVGKGGARNISWLHSLANEMKRRDIDRREAVSHWDEYNE